ncbi:MAG: 2-hydroxy-6-oxo-6-phenylhexa-2,4-dienoate hydrolase [Candidatus Anoxychlamydiales bacterium]|nr:2-hydroxy-6-oxo-6-phenylhexa-2,4-dienoate hydrolase [Candidatus Anoxychlamydiales bacterium]
MPHIKANNIDIYYEYEGNGPPLVIIGGFASDHKLLNDFVTPLKKNYKVLLMDLRGFGDSEVTAPPYSIDLLAKDVFELMNCLNIENAYIYGHSMGSAILQTMCLNYPQKIKKALLSGTFLKIPYTTQMLFELVPKLFEINLNQEIISKILMPWIYSSDYLKNKENFQNTLESISKREINPKGYEGQSIALANFDSTNWISKIKSEILILIGKEDIDTPLYCSERVHEKLKNSKLKIIENAAHMMYREKPNEVYKIILDFFK